MTDEMIANIRLGTLGITGLVCAAYGILALATAHPAPMPAWIPGGFGFASAIAITLAARIAPATAVRMAMDESYDYDNHRAQRFSYWIALFLYPLFGLLLWSTLVAWPVAFAAMGTFTGASYLLLFTWFDLKARR